MKAFLKTELERFLDAVDAALETPADVIVIGGSAASLGYGATSPTRDIDTWTALSEALVAAIKIAQEKTGLRVPVSRATVADAPDGLEERLERILPRLRRLKVFIPEKHDLALMKAIRCDEHDLQAIAEIHAHSPLDLDTLVERYRDEMDPVGDPARLRSNFLLMIERLFPEAVDDVERHLPRKRRYSDQ